MDESYTITVQYKAATYNFEARLDTAGYIPRFYVLINGLEVVYEPDEDRNYRAILHESALRSVKEQDVELIKAVGEKIESLRER